MSHTWPLALCWLATTVDRAGVPAAMLAGLAWAMASGTHPAVVVSGCVIAGIVGDMACYGLGRQLAHGQRSPLTRASLVGRLEALGQRYSKHVLFWLAAGRLFPAVNQLFPVVAGLRRHPMARVVPIVCVANALWLGVVGGVAWGALDTLQHLSTPIQVGSAAAGLLLLSGLRCADATRPSRTVPPPEPDTNPFRTRGHGDVGNPEADT